MDRPIALPGELVADWLITKPAQDTMVALGRLASAVFGNTGVAHGLSCAATAIPSMQITIGPGEIYQQAPVEQTMYGTLPPNTVDTILKQGILSASDGPLNLPYGGTFAAPAAPGQSISYLVQAQYQDRDVSIDPSTGLANVVLNFYNSVAPQTPYGGPNNSGAASNTLRKGIVAFSVKPGVPASTGSQLPPTADGGWIGLYVVSVAAGQTSILSTNIAPAPNAPFVAALLTGGMGGSGGYAPLVSPVFLGLPSGPTAPKFTNTPQLATTEFVRQAGGSIAAVYQLNTTTALSPAMTNSLVLCGGTGGTYILPPLATVPPGTKQYFASQGGASSVVATGLDPIVNGGSTVTNLPFGGSDTVEVTASASGWQVTGGTMLLGASRTFRAGRGNFVLQAGLVSASAALPSTNVLTFTAPCDGLVHVFASNNTSSTNCNFSQQIFVNGTPISGSYGSGSATDHCVAPVSAGSSVLLRQVLIASATPTWASSYQLSYLFVPGI